MAAVARVDIDHNNIDGFVSKLISNKVKFAVVSYEGPGGGNPCLYIERPTRDDLKTFLLEHYDPDMVDEDFELYCRTEA